MFSISLRIEAIRSAIHSLSPAPFTMVVLSLLMFTFSAVPNVSSVAWSRRKPFSSEITQPPVSTAISSSIALRRSPKPGALTAHTLRPARRRFTTSVVNASESTSSAITRRPRPVSATDCRIGRNSLRLEIFLS